MASSATADGGQWLTLSSASGVAPSNVTVSINPANLPSQGRVAGTYTGQILLESLSDIVTIPVTVTIGDSVIKQPAALNFTMAYDGATPSTQSLTVASTDAVIGFYASAIIANGGNWLSIPNYNCCGPTTPYTIGATVYYTTNGTTPTSSSTKYTGPITLSASSVLKFIAIGTNGVASAVRSVTTTIQ